jgi:DNA ligase (NAD+)
MFRNSKEDFYIYLKALSDAYYTTENPMVNDGEFDDLVAEYEEQYNDPYVYLGSGEEVGGGGGAEGKKTKLPVFMSSLNKCKDESSLSRFNAKNVQVQEVVFSEKLDGISLLLETKNKKTTLYTRGDGENGTDVSHLLEYLKFPQTTLGLVRGELVIQKKLCEILGENLRNIVCGAVNSKTSNLEVLKHVEFIAYSLPKHDLTPKQSFELLQASGFLIPQIVVSEGGVCSLEKCNQILTSFQKTSRYFIDGLVVAKNIFVPITSVENPKHIVAFKRTGASRETQVVQVLWQQSRYGVLHPRVQINPIDIDGCTIAFVSGVNAKYIVENKIGPGTRLQIHRSGDVIPNILRIIESTEAQLPGETYEMDGVHFKVNKSSGADIARLTYSMKTLQAKGISEQTVEKLYNAGYTTEILLWNANVFDLIKIEGIKQKSAENIVETLRESRERLSLLNVLLISACFNNFGESKLKKIIGCFEVKKYLKTCHLSKESILSLLASISIKTLGDSFIEYCKTFRKSALFMSLLELVEVEQHGQPSQVIVHTRVVFSGFRDKDLQSKCLEKGIEVSDGKVNKKTSYLVVDDLSSTSSKVELAKSLGVPMLSKDQFVANYNLK